VIQVHSVTQLVLENADCLNKHISRQRVMSNGVGKCHVCVQNYITERYSRVVSTPVLYSGRLVKLNPLP
jgi:hypothetical protein